MGTKVFETMKLSKQYIYDKVSRRQEPTWQVDTDGYLSASITLPEGTFNVRKHILVFYKTNGYIPDFVDHKDNNKLNNAPDNLREASKCQNQQNSKRPKNNSSGVKGVSRTKHGKWQVNIMAYGVKHYGGLFDSLEDAKQHVESLRLKLHSDFARSV